MKAHETIRCEETAPGVIRVTLDRAAKHNAINTAMIRELTDVAAHLAASSCRAVVLAAAGESFCAGGDLGWMREQFDAPEARRGEQARALFRMLKALDELPQMLIGLVQGPAYGGGVGFACVCDVVIAAPAARFALTETRLGLIPATISPFVMRRSGPAALRRIGLHGAPIGAEEAKAMGLVSEIASPGALEDALQRHLDLLLSAAPGAVADAKALYRTLAEKGGDEQTVANALAERWRSDEARAGIAAFFAKEAPPWLK